MDSGGLTASKTLKQLSAAKPKTRRPPRLSKKGFGQRSLRQAQNRQGGTKFPRIAGLPICSNSSFGSQLADILKYFEGLKRGPNVEIGFKDFFDMSSN